MKKTIRKLIRIIVIIIAIIFIINAIKNLYNENKTSLTMAKNQVIIIENLNYSFDQIRVYRFENQKYVYIFDENYNNIFNNESKEAIDTCIEQMENNNWHFILKCIIIIIVFSIIFFSTM